MFGPQESNEPSVNSARPYMRVFPVPTLHQTSPHGPTVAQYEPSIYASIYKFVWLSTWTIDVLPRLLSPPLLVGAGVSAPGLLGARCILMFSSAPAPRPLADLVSAAFAWGC